jgi:hypothetical protein
MPPAKSNSRLTDPYALPRPVLFGHWTNSVIQWYIKIVSFCAVSLYRKFFAQRLDTLTSKIPRQMS